MGRFDVVDFGGMCTGILIFLLGLCHEFVVWRMVFVVIGIAITIIGGIEFFKSLNSEELS